MLERHQRFAKAIPGRSGSASRVAGWIYWMRWPLATPQRTSVGPTSARLELTPSTLDINPGSTGPARIPPRRGPDLRCRTYSDLGLSLRPMVPPLPLSIGLSHAGAVDDRPGAPARSGDASQPSHRTLGAKPVNFDELMARPGGSAMIPDHRHRSRALAAPRTRPRQGGPIRRAGGMPATPTGFPAAFLRFTTSARYCANLARADHTYNSHFHRADKSPHDVRPSSASSPTSTAIPSSRIGQSLVTLLERLFVGGYYANLLRP